jgi:hypothetical protein
MTTIDEAKQHGIELPAPGTEPAFLGDPVVDQLLEAVIALSAEVWIERDRRMLLESLLEEKGLVARNELEMRVSPAEEKDDRARAREELVHRVLGSLKEVADSR